MKRIFAVTAVALALASAGISAQAADPRGMEEAKEHGCLKCHDIDKKKVGPSYKDISAKLKGKSVDDGIAAVKAKPVHKSAVEKTSAGSMKDIMTWVMSL